ncbi:GNAT family N-acetyltransferase [Hyphobacterium sp. HN65]|uniref:GNAT family N-acetyltransferase n=1 Tax=Hyphobacterium lacteum TaxID=3116575 RepID=A0ABU7LM88_9PROT|nr:GNAT family N-acetyltransferase [Hyphobacterium sp. HN65]MEE2525048.1 GNAT family N-acetyltransferase [Hyphobacterium sp. HN65]
MTSFPVAPTVKTKRLVLRALKADDFENVHRIWSDAENVKFLGGKPSTRMESWRRITNSAGMWPILGYGYWAVDEASSGSFIGMVGFADFQRDEPEGFSGDPEIGYVIDKAFHGQGYGREAMAACMQWLDETHGRRRSICMIDPDNIASIRIAERLGYRIFDEGVLGGKTLLLLERL